MPATWLLGSNQDIRPAATSLVWDAEHVADSLERLRVYVESEAAKTINWYFDSKKSKALWSRCLRFLAVALSTVAGVLPIVVTLWKSKPAGLESGLIVSALLGLAAGVVGFDHFFGFSSGWIRYVVTATGIQAALEEFRLDWELLSAHLSSPPTGEQVLVMIERAKTFRTSIANMVLDETKAWAAEFQSNLAQLEKDVKTSFEQQRTKVEEDLKARTIASRPGAIELKVANALTADNRSFTVELEKPNHQTESDPVEGATAWSRASLPPGQYKVVVKAKRAGATVQASKIVIVEPGSVVTVELPLPG